MDGSAGRRSKVLPTAQSLTIIIAISALTAFLTIGVFYIFFNVRPYISEFPEKSCYASGEVQICFFKDGLSADGMIAVLSSFYSNLIVILVSILTLIGVVAALSIKYSARQHVQSELPILTAEYFESPTGKKAIIEQVLEANKALAERLVTMEKTTADHSEFIEGFSSRLEKLEFVAETMDTGEKVVEPPHPEEANKRDQ